MNLKTEISESFEELGNFYIKSYYLTNDTVNIVICYNCKGNSFTQKTFLKKSSIICDGCGFAYGNEIINSAALQQRRLKQNR
jgi:hypothetical protein